MQGFSYRVRGTAAVAQRVAGFFTPPAGSFRSGNMTRETKLGLLITCSFFALLGVVLYTKVKGLAHHEPSPFAKADGSVPEAPDEPTPLPSLGMEALPGAPTLKPAPSGSGIRQVSGVGDKPPDFDSGPAVPTGDAPPKTATTSTATPKPPKATTTKDDGWKIPDFDKAEKSLVSGTRPAVGAAVGASPAKPAAADSKPGAVASLTSTPGQTGSVPKAGATAPAPAPSSIAPAPDSFGQAKPPTASGASAALTIPPPPPSVVPPSDSLATKPATATTPAGMAAHLGGPTRAVAPEPGVAPTQVPRVTPAADDAPENKTPAPSSPPPSTPEPGKAATTAPPAPTFPPAAPEGKSPTGAAAPLPSVETKTAGTAPATPDAKSALTAPPPTPDTKVPAAPPAGGLNPVGGSPMPPLGTQPTAATPPIQAGTPAARPSATTNPQVESYDEETHIYQDGETFDTISEAKYFSRKYAQALLQFNRDHPRGVDSLRQQVPALQPGQPIYIPELGVLQRKYGTLIPPDTSAPATPAPPPASVGAPAAPAPSGAGASAMPAPTATPTAGTVLRPNSKEPSYRVHKEGGEMFSVIASRTLGKLERWGDIYALNQTYNPMYPVPAGAVLRLPADAQVPPENAQ